MRLGRPHQESGDVARVLVDGLRAAAAKDDFWRKDAARAEEIRRDVDVPR